jgi:hypothetical protein
VAVSAYSDIDPTEESNVFSAYLAKPVQKADLLGKSLLGKHKNVSSSNFY